MRRLEQAPGACGSRSHEVGEAPVVNVTAIDGEWREVKSD